MVIFAHRGILKLYPENTLLSLSKSIERGFGIETDLRLTKDNDFLLIHDDNFERLTGDDISVANLTLAEGLSMRYKNSEETVPSLRQFLELTKKLDYKEQTAIHLKADSQTDVGLKKLVEYWEEFDLYDKAFVFDLTLDSAQRLKKLDKKIKIALIVSEYSFEPTIHLWNDVKDLSVFDIVWAAEYRTMYAAVLIDEMRKVKEKVYAMSPDVHTALGHPLAYAGFQETWKNLIAWKIDGICTDEPIQLQKVLNQS